VATTEAVISNTLCPTLLKEQGESKRALTCVHSRVLLQIYLLLIQVLLLLLNYDGRERDNEGTFLNEPRGSSRHAPVSKTVAASGGGGGGGGDDEAFKAAVAFDTFTATSPRPLAPRKPVRATSSTVLRASSAQANDDEGRANLALLRAREMPSARQGVGDGDGAK